ncbi:hypothetical protein Mal4_58130 [Maioricimonas rarisocia]|uniref:Uncharacterized protein n=1 Tax=Maioricimonas rarisocia TaxID=2528026 RepID=A0A517ZG40_9PLAN|nr:hypothetical protein [Maioricimonas rarisocia]QDU41445.1 hypothetical protein Mal4_58130 [Maioricimonas rarisocia]
MSITQARKLSLPIPVGQAVAWVLWLMVAVISLFIAGRAIAGTFERSPSAFLALSLTLLGMSATLTGWWLDSLHESRRDVRTVFLTGAASVLLPVGTGLCVAGAASSATLAILLLLCLGGLTGVGAATWKVAADDAAIPQNVAAAASVPIETPLEPETDVESFETEPAADGPAFPEGRTEPDDLLTDEHVQQQVIRRQMPDGQDLVEAILRARFQPGQKQCILHVPLWPPLGPPVDVECEPLSDHEVRIEATLVRQYGCRIEVTRTGPRDAAETVSIGVLASGQVVPEQRAA